MADSRGKRNWGDTPSGSESDGEMDFPQLLPVADGADDAVDDIAANEDDNIDDAAADAVVNDAAAGAVGNAAADAAVGSSAAAEPAVIAIRDEKRCFPYFRPPAPNTCRTLMRHYERNGIDEKHHIFFRHSLKSNVKYRNRDYGKLAKKWRVSHFFLCGEDSMHEFVTDGFEPHIGRHRQ